MSEHLEKVKSDLIKAIEELEILLKENYPTKDDEISDLNALKSSIEESSSIDAIKAVCGYDFEYLMVRMGAIIYHEFKTEESFYKLALLIQAAIMPTEAVC